MMRIRGWQKIVLVARGFLLATAVYSSLYAWWLYGERADRGVCPDVCLDLALLRLLSGRADWGVRLRMTFANSGHGGDGA